MRKNYHVKIKRVFDWQSIVGFILALIIFALIIDKCRTQQTQEYINKYKFENYITKKINNNQTLTQEDLENILKYIKTK